MSEDRTVKVGVKKKHLLIPDGYDLTTSGIIKQGDMYANVWEIKWEPVDFLDVGTEVELYDFVIRKMKPV